MRIAYTVYDLPPLAIEGGGDDDYDDDHNDHMQMGQGCCATLLEVFACMHLAGIRRGDHRHHTFIIMLGTTKD